MPLIIVTGFPCSGKSYRAQQIAADLERGNADEPSKRRKIQIIESHHASQDEAHKPEVGTNDLRDKIYNSAAQEKTARAEEFSAIKRALSKDTIVIADGLNYIKGYRYQLWCEAKAAGTRCCVVHVAAQEDECKDWNRERLRASGRETSQNAERPLDTIGKDKAVIGTLLPESHTAIYGDRAVRNQNRSRSSSIDGQVDGQNGSVTGTTPDDAMTLKSLYISDHTESLQRHLLTRNGHQETATLPNDNGSNAAAKVEVPSPASIPPYSPQTLNLLIMRYEPPSPFSRWDTPLFTIPTTDKLPPSAAICAALFPQPTKPTSAKALSHLQSQTDVPNKDANVVKPHAATVLPAATSANALQTLESATLEVIKALLARYKEVADDEPVSISFSVSNPDDPVSDTIDIEDLSLPAGQKISQPVLQRLRRKFTQLQRGSIAHGKGYVGARGRQEVVERFVQFLTTEWGGSDDR